MTTNFISEPTTIGLSEKSHGLLKRLTEDRRNGAFAEMADAYRFAIALALAHGVIPGEIPAPRQTIFNVGTLDPDKMIYNAVKALLNTADTPVYRWAERLAEWGVGELSARADRGDLDIGEILKEVELTEVI
jgi:hypothetical protein